MTFLTISIGLRLPSVHHRIDLKQTDRQRLMKPAQMLRHAFVY
jgi:hypothetical protein